jgi:hypothetical protein
MTGRTVADGATVDTGARVGSVGAEGNVSGPHLHFERHTVATGGWSCAIVTDPAPSIAYPTPPTQTPKPEDDPMPSYSRTKLTKPLNTGPDWKSIPWDVVAAGDAGTEGAAYLSFGPGVFTAALTVRLELDPGAPPVSTRWLEKEKQGSTWVDVETYPPVEHLPTSGETFLTDTRVQSIGKGRRLVAQVRCPEGGTIVAAELNVAYF